MNGLYSWLLLFGLVVLLLGVFTKWFQKRWYLTEPLTDVVLGVILGPAGLGLLSLSVTGDQTQFLQEISRITSCRGRRRPARERGSPGASAR